VSKSAKVVLVSGFAKITRDITERHEAQVRLKATQEQMRGVHLLRCRKLRDWS
jgi:hypothetical protein